MIFSCLCRRSESSEVEQLDCLHPLQVSDSSVKDFCSTRLRGSYSYPVGVQADNYNVSAHRATRKNKSFFDIVSERLAIGYNFKSVYQVHLKLF